MGATKVLSANEVKRITGVSGKQYKRIQWHSAEIVVRQILTIQEFMNTVHSILHDCQTPDGDIAPELIDFAIRANVIAAYAFVDLPKEIDALYYTVYASDLYDTIASAINKQQLASIKFAVQLYITPGEQS